MTPSGDRLDGSSPSADGLARSLLPRCSFPPAGTPVTCAFSGGADSTALLVLAGAAGCVVTAVHVDHQLRASSTAEADRAEALAASLAVPFQRRTVTVGPGANVEARARAARRAALGPAAMTGHTADDQAETVLINLLRGAGASGLSGMRPGPTKPLLGLRRAETRALCDGLRLTPVDDPSNADDQFLRNRVRHAVLPHLADVAGRDVVPLLVRSADVLRADDELLDHLAAAIDATDARALAGADPALARRALRRWLVVDGLPPDLATVERALAVARGDGIACELGAGRRLRRHRQRLQIVDVRASPTAAQ